MLLRWCLINPIRKGTYTTLVTMLHCDWLISAEGKATVDLDSNTASQEQEEERGKENHRRCTEAVCTKIQLQGGQKKQANVFTQMK